MDGRDGKWQGRLPTSHPRLTQPSIPPGSINEYQLRLGRKRVYFVSGWTRVCRWDPLRTRTIPELFIGVFTTRRYINPSLPLPFTYDLRIVSCMALSLLFSRFTVQNRFYYIARLCWCVGAHVSVVIYQVNLGWLVVLQISLVWIPLERCFDGPVALPGDRTSE